MKKYLIFTLLIIALTYSCQKRIPIAPEFLELPYPTEEDNEPISKNISALLLKSWLSFQKGNIEDANYYVRKAINESPKLPPLWIMQGYINLAIGNIKGAERNFNFALELKENYATAINALAFIKFRNENYPQAYELYNKLYTLFPNFPYAKVKFNLVTLKTIEYYKSKAQNAVKHRKYLDAIEMYKKAIVISPTVWELHYELALIFLELKDYANANVYLQLATNLNPDNVTIKEVFANSLFSGKDYNHALEQYKQLLTLNPNNLDWINKRDECLRQIKFMQLPNEFQNIANSEKITKAVFAAYLIYKIPVIAKINSTNNIIITDIGSHWAKDYLIQVANLNILEVNPNHTLLPDSILKRLELALAINKLLLLLASIKQDINLN